MLATMSRTLSSSPRPIDETPITTATPITIPSTVSDERSLLPRIVSVAIWRISANSSLRIMADHSHFKAQRCNRIKLRRLARRIYAKENADAGRHKQSCGDGPERRRRRHANEQGYRLGKTHSRKPPRHSTDQCQNHRLDQKLHKDVATPRAQSL